MRRRLTATSPPSRGDDSEFRERLRRLGAQRRRFGYRRLHILLRREGIKLNHKKLFRTYRQERLTVRRRGGRKRALGMRAAITLPQGAKPRWSLDFVSDVLADGRRFRVLVISTCPAFDPCGGAALLNVAGRLRGWGAAFVGGPRGSGAVPR